MEKFLEFFVLCVSSKINRSLYLYTDKLQRILLVMAWILEYNSTLPKLICQTYTGPRKINWFGETHKQTNKKAITDFVSALECICKSVFTLGLPSHSRWIWRLPVSAAGGWSLTYSFGFHVHIHHTDHQMVPVEPKGLQLVFKPVVLCRQRKLRGAMKSEHKLGTSKGQASQVPGGFPSWRE